MGRKVFISFLGNTKYSESIYTEEPGSPKKCFAQEVMLDSNCNEWDANDRIYIICTDGENGSFKKNWEGNCSGKPLKEILQEKPYSSIVEPIILDETSENDMWAVFDCVYSLLSDLKDEIYLDVTNAFRSFSVLASTLLQYANYMKDAEIKEIFYSLYDKMSQTSYIQRLSSVVELQQCIVVAGGVVKYGRLNKLAELLEQNNLADVATPLKTIDGQFGAIRGGDIKKGKAIMQLEMQRRVINRASLSSPVKNVLNHAIDNLKAFKRNDCLENELAAARWAISNGMLPQAYTFGKEYINAKVAEIIGESFNPYKDLPKIEKKEKEKKYLEYLNTILALNEKTLVAKQFKDDLADFLDNTLSVFEMDLIKQLRVYYVDLNRYRNQICHAKNGADYEELRSFFEENFEKCIDIIENFKNMKSPDICQAQQLFINLSNHPSSSWSTKQLAAAASLGVIADLAFPLIDETDNEEQIVFKVERLCDKIVSIAPSSDLTTVHIMGEMTFTYKMINALKAQGYTCVASTTKRIVEELPDGSKNVKFEFCQFREY